MPRIKNRIYRIIEWERKPDNVGTMLFWPIDSLVNYIEEEGSIEIVRKFWKKDLVHVTLFDICTLTAYWVNDSDIVSARLAIAEHPTHAFEEYIFDRAEDRLIITIRQPDLDGAHWKDKHIHIVVGKKDPNDPRKIINPLLKEKHVTLAWPKIEGKYIMKII